MLRQTGLSKDIYLFRSERSVVLNFWAFHTWFVNGRCLWKGEEGVESTHAYAAGVNVTRSEPFRTIGSEAESSALWVELNVHFCCDIRRGINELSPV